MMKCRNLLEPDCGKGLYQLGDFNHTAGMGIVAQKGRVLMATLKDFKNRISQGGAACRIGEYDSALVFRILDGHFDSYYVGGIGNDQAQECLTWEEVEDEVGSWADLPGWQSYRLSEVRV